MRWCARSVVSFLLLALFAAAAQAQYADDPIVIHRNRDIRSLDELELDRAARFELLQRVQAMTDEIRLLSQTRESLLYRIAEYERFKTNAFFLTLEHLYLQLRDVDASLKRLRREKMVLQYYGAEEIRLRTRELQQKAGLTSA
jgi:hypothetical protein